MSNFRHSTMHVGTRGPKTEANPHGWYDFEPNIDKPCILILGGDGTTDARSSNGMAKMFQEMINQRGAEGVIDCCAVTYDFGGLTVANSRARDLLMGSHNRGVLTDVSGSPELIAEMHNPQYIDELYDTFFANRIMGVDGAKLPVDEVVRRMRNVTVFAHCHGAYTYSMLENKLQTSLTGLGYTNVEQDRILRNLVCSAYAPYAPLGKSRTTMISFANAEDMVVGHNNYFQRSVQELQRSGDLRFGYYPGEHGNVFIAPEYMEAHPHNYVWSRFRSADRIDDLKITQASNWILDGDGLMAYRAVPTLMGNVVANNAMSALEGGDVLSTENLICDWRYINNGRVHIDDSATDTLRSVYRAASDVGQEQLRDISLMSRFMARHREYNRNAVQHLADLDQLDPSKQALRASQQALGDVQYVDGGYFVPKDSQAILALQEGGVELQFDAARNGYFIPQSQAASVVNVNRQARFNLDPDFNLCFNTVKEVYWGDTDIVGYETPSDVFITPERANELINYYGGESVSGFRSHRIDLVYNDEIGRVSVARHSMRNYAHFQSQQTRNLGGRSFGLTLTDDGHFMIPFSSQDDLLQMQSSLRMCGVGTSIQGDNLIVDDVNALARSPFFERTSDELDRCRRYAEQGVDLNSPQFRSDVLMPLSRKPRTSGLVEDILTPNEALSFGPETPPESLTLQPLEADDSIPITRLGDDVRTLQPLDVDDSIPITRLDADVHTIEYAIPEERLAVVNGYRNSSDGLKIEITDLSLEVPETRLETVVASAGSADNGVILDHSFNGSRRMSDSTISPLTMPENVRHVGVRNFDLMSDNLDDLGFSLEKPGELIAGKYRIPANAPGNFMPRTEITEIELPPPMDAPRTSTAHPTAATRASGVGSRVMRGVAAVGTIAEVVGAAVDPEGTAEFNDDLLHARFGKIGEDLSQAMDALDSQPITETIGQMGSAIGTAVAEHYEGTDTFAEGATRTLDAVATGAENVETIAGTGLGSVASGFYSLANDGLEFVGADWRFAPTSHSIGEYRNDRMGYIRDHWVPDGMDAQTGRRYQDSYFSIIDRNDVNAMKGQIDYQRGQWNGLISSRITLRNIVQELDGTGNVVSRREVTTTQSPVVYAAFKARDEMVSMLTEDPRMYEYVYDVDSASQQTALMGLVQRMPRPGSVASPEDIQKRRAAISSLISHSTATPENINKVDKDGNSAFLYAAQAGDSQILTMLNNKNANVNQRNNNGENALHLYRGDDPVMVSTLINRGIDMDARDNRGMTPLQRQVYDFACYPDKRFEKRVAAFLECCPPEHVQELASTPEFKNITRFVINASPEVARIMRERHPDFVADLYGQGKPNEGQTASESADATALAQSRADEASASSDGTTGAVTPTNADLQGQGVEEGAATTPSAENNQTTEAQTSETGAQTTATGDQTATAGDQTTTAGDQTTATGEHQTNASTRLREAATDITGASSTATACLANTELIISKKLMSCIV